MLLLLLLLRRNLQHKPPGDEMSYRTHLELAWLEWRSNSRHPSAEEEPRKLAATVRGKGSARLIIWPCVKAATQTLVDCFHS